MASRTVGALAALAALGLLAATCDRPDAPSAPQDPVIHPPKLQPAEVPADLGRRAYDHVAELVSYGPRYTGSAGWARAVDHIEATLKGAGLDPVRDRWTDEPSGMTFENVHATFNTGERLNEVLATSDVTLYRRGNFSGTWDQILCDALMQERDAEISFSAGVRQ